MTPLLAQSLHEPVVYLYAFWRLEGNDKKEVDQAECGGWRCRRQPSVCWTTAAALIKALHARLGLAPPVLAEWPGSFERAVFNETLFPDDSPPRWLSSSTLPSVSGFSHLQRVHDVLALTMAATHAGPADESKWAELASLLSTAAIEGEELLGATWCYAARLANLAAGTEIAGRILQGRLPVESACFDFPNSSSASFLISRPDTQDYLVFLYPDDHVSETAVAPFVNELLPDLARLQHKISDQYRRQYKARLAPRIADFDQALDKIGPPASEIRELDNQLLRFSEAYRGFSDRVAIMERIRKGVEINFHNLDRHITRNSLPQQGWVKRAFEEARSASEQLDADISYHRIKERQAETSLAGLQLRVEIIRAELDNEELGRARRVDVLLAGFGTFFALGVLIEAPLAVEVAHFVKLLVNPLIKPLGIEMPSAAPFPHVAIFLVRLFLIAIGALVLLVLIPRLWSRLVPKFPRWLIARLPHWLLLEKTHHRSAHNDG